MSQYPILVGLKLKSDSVAQIVIGSSGDPRPEVVPLVVKLVQA